MGHSVIVASRAVRGALAVEQGELRHMNRLDVLVADDHRLMLAGIRRALESSEDTHVVGTATTGMQVVPAIAATDPNVVLLDIRMPGLDGISCLKRIRERYPLLPVVMLSTYGDADHVEAARAAGASAYVSKRIDPLGLPALLRTIVAGAPFAVHGLEPSAAETNGHRLTERELSILRAVAGGLSNREVGKDLWVSEQTVKFHLRNLYRKLGISSRAEATLRIRAPHRRVDVVGGRPVTVAHVPASSRGCAAALERRLVRLTFDLHDGALQDVAALVSEVRLFRAQLASVSRTRSQARSVAASTISRPASSRSTATSATSRTAWSRSRSCSDLSRRRSWTSSRRSTAVPTSGSPSEVSGSFEDLSRSQRIALLRVLQEALANVREHSDAADSARRDRRRR